MCGRFSLTKEEEAINERFRLFGSHDPYIPRYNGAPTQALSIIPNSDPKNRMLFNWGLVPSWSKSMKDAAKLINARAETIAKKPSFKNSFQSKRCLVPADGFFEWKRSGAKDPYYICRPDRALFSMAGLWDEWKDESGKILRTFTIITCEPNEIMRSIHDRMPVILPPHLEQEWLENNDITALQKMLIPSAEELTSWKVSKRVNKVKEDDAGLLEEAIDDQLSLF